MNFIEASRRLISLDSTPSHGTSEVVEFLSVLAKDLGFEVEVIEESYNGLVQPNIVFQPKSKSGLNGGLLLQTHLDTVDPGNFSLWDKTNSNPFNVSIYGDSMFGLGVADSKLDILCKLFAASEFTGKKLTNSLRVAGTFGAETSMAGAMRLIRKKVLSEKLALVGEPTDLQLVHAGPAMAVVEITIPFSEEEIEHRGDHDVLESTSTQTRLFRGRAAHSAHSIEGDNAIVKMLDYMDQLPEGLIVIELDGGVGPNTVPASAVMEIDMAGGLKNPIGTKIKGVFKILRELEGAFEADIKPSETEVSKLNFNIGMIRTSSDSIRIQGSSRLPPSLSPDQYKNWMNRLGMGISGFGASYQVIDYRRGFLTPVDSKFLKVGQSVLSGLDVKKEVSKTTVSTEASVFSRYGIECLVFGPGKSAGNSHAPNEVISVKELSQAQDFYKGMIQEICL